MRSLNIITECCVDTNMVETLCSVLVNHQKCCFILDVAKNAKVDVRSFGFSSKLKEFTNRTKTLSSDKDPDLKALFYALKEFGEFKVLSSVLMYLNNNKYNSTEAGVKCIVEEGRCKRVH